jgi:CBS domain containing-hemolysin-like protein
VRADFGPTAVSEAIREYCHRRLPVVGADSDDIVGVLNVRAFVLADAATQANWLEQCVMKPIYVPEQADLNQVLTHLRETDQGMVLVVDEYGGVAGLLTAEDILEQVVGDLADEYDEPSYQIAELSVGHWRVNGTTPVDELQDLLKMDLGGSDADTAGGLAMELFENLPATGDSCEMEDFTLEIHKMGDKRVLEVDIFRRPGSPIEPDDEEDLL